MAAMPESEDTAKTSEAQLFSASCKASGSCLGKDSTDWLANENTVTDIEKWISKNHGECPPCALLNRTVESGDSPEW